MTVPIDDDRLERHLPDAKPAYSRGEAIGEANRCLYCHDAPCVVACPTGIDIPGFIRKIATENVRGSAKTILSANLLGYSCARVCPVEVLCVGACVYNDWNRYPPILRCGIYPMSSSRRTMHRRPPATNRVARRCSLPISATGHAVKLCLTCRNSKPTQRSRRGIHPRPG